MADDKKHAEIDAALVRQLAEILNETDLTEVEVERGELRQVILNYRLETTK